VKRPDRAVDTGPGLDLDYDRRGDHHEPYPEEAFTVSGLTLAAKEIIEGAFPMMWVRGEVTDFKSHRNGHWYFCLRDSTAQVRAVIWSKDAQRIPATPDEGMQVLAYGRLTVYAARGEMQFTVTRLEAEGDGLWRKKLEITRKRLEADGLLAADRKRRLPPYPRTVAVITSPDGAALRDIVAVLERRRAKVRLVVVPAAVQGDGAILEIRRAIVRVAKWGGADALILARGGGSREDLWTFNDERLARTLAASPVPTISAVGHEVDISMCDLVADVRAATPSAAAEIVARSQAELEQILADIGTRMARTVGWRVDGARNRQRAAGRALRHASAQLVQRSRMRLAGLAGSLDALSPLSTLHRGYAVPRDSDGRTLRSIADFAADMPFELLLRDGAVGAIARSVRATRSPEET
jgi:exodeoxyribonuclease VII large subunit